MNSGCRELRSGTGPVPMVPSRRDDEPSAQGCERGGAPRDEGHALLLMTALLLVATVFVVATIEIGRLLNDRARARTAADAAALAGAAAGEQEAASLAAANGAVLVSYTEEASPDDPDAIAVTVSVQVGRAGAQARAEGLVEWAAP